MTATGDLHYFPDTRPGITRRRAGRGWSYRAPDGTRIDDATERSRLNALAVPPAYDDVWMCPDPRGHLQATGRDARRRKQYRYHPDWTARRSEKKFDHLAEFGALLPRIRRRIRRDLKAGAGDRDYAIAAVLAVIDRLALRVGHRDYADENGTYGATTLRGRHLSLAEDGVALRYRAKGGDRVTRRVRDRRLARVLHRLDDLPGADLFSWLDDTGAVHAVTSDAVNAALRDVTGHDAITAKTFRTWSGTVAAMDVALGQPDLTIKAMAEAAGDRLANTPSIARNSYIHPAVIGLADTPLDDRIAWAQAAPERRGLRATERAVLHLLTS